MEREKCPACGKMMAKQGEQGEKCPQCGKMVCATCGCETCK